VNVLPDGVLADSEFLSDIFVVATIRDRAKNLPLARC